MTAHELARSLHCRENVVCPAQCETGGFSLAGCWRPTANGLEQCSVVCVLKQNGLIVGRVHGDFDFSSRLLTIEVASDSGHIFVAAINEIRSGFENALFAAGHRRDDRVRTAVVVNKLRVPRGASSTTEC